MDKKEELIFWIGNKESIITASGIPEEDYNKYVEYLRSMINK